VFRDIVYRAAKRWIAGKEMPEALEKAKEANDKGMGAILNYLGEDITDKRVAQRHVEEYLMLQRRIAESGIDGCVSAKLTQFGLGVDDSFVLEEAELLAAEAERLGQTLWIDMEGSSSTSKTIEIYSKLLERHRNVGLALQAYLRRSESDLKSLLDIGGKVRLVKGAYREPSRLVFGSRAQVIESFAKLMSTLFEKSEGFAIATHDTVLIDGARALYRSHKTAFEFEMLRGIRDELKADLVKSGYRVVDYLPYGEDWYAYSVRRIREHPSNIWLLLRSL